MSKRKMLIEGFWDRFNQVIKESGQTKKDLAEIIGIDRKTLIESGSMPSPLVIARVCAITGASSDWLLGIWGRSPKRTEMKDGIRLDHIIENMQRRVLETEEEFIFETIGPFCDRVVQKKVPKHDLEQALIQYYGKDEWLQDLKNELWEDGHYFTDEYQGVWVRYRDITKAIDKRMEEKR